MDVHFHTHNHKGHNTVRAMSESYPDGTYISLVNDDGSAVNIYGPPEVAGAFAKMVKLFNEAHHPKSKEIEHLGTVALDEPTNT